ncbi:MAG TPA: hypothetical protein VHC22_33205 [Pirellulales bacterium]|nr:hypothetical protein [Pirellulales bacterium]
MKWRMAVLCSLAFLVLALPAAIDAAPKPKKGSPADTTAKKVDVFKAADDKQIQMQVTVQGLGNATLTLTNVTETPLNVEVPLAVAAVPNAPQGANQAYFASMYGTPGTPQSIAVAVDPKWSAGVDKKAGNRKTNVKAVKKGKPGDDDAKDEKKDDKKDDEKKDDAKTGDAVVALVPLAPGAMAQLPMYSLGLERAKPRATIGVFRLAELDKVSQAPHMKKLLEQMVQGIVPADTAQILAWHYHGPLTWDEMATTGVLPAQLEVAKKFADVVEGNVSPDAAPVAETTKKKKKR